MTTKKLKPTLYQHDDNDSCFECDSINDLHKHHVVPRSLGGKKTIKICSVCHGKIHNLDFTNHGNLIRIALKKKKRNGELLGRPKGKCDPDEILKKYPDIYLCLLDKMSLAKTVKHTGKSRSTVQRIKKILYEKNNFKTD